MFIVAHSSSSGISELSPEQINSIISSMEQNKTASYMILIAGITIFVLYCIFKIVMTLITKDNSNKEFIQLIKDSAEKLEKHYEKAFESYDNMMKTLVNDRMDKILSSSNSIYQILEKIIHRKD